MSNEFWALMIGAGFGGVMARTIHWPLERYAATLGTVSMVCMCVIIAIWGVGP